MAVKKKATKKKAAKTPAVKRSPAIKEAYTKSKLIEVLADKNDLTKKQIKSVLEDLADIAESHLKPRGAGEFTVPGMLKLKVKIRPARKARMGRNPATGEEIKIAAQPKKKVLKARILKQLSDII